MSPTLYPIMAKMLARMPFVADFFSTLSGRPQSVRQLLSSTGSQIDDEMVELYLRLIRDRDHVDGALQMMAAWDLDRLLDRLESITAPVLFLIGAEDKTVPPRIGEAAAARLPNASCKTLPNLGHLAHEEAPEVVSAAISQAITHTAPVP